MDSSKEAPPAHAWNANFDFSNPFQPSAVQDGSVEVPTGADAEVQPPATASSVPKARPDEATHVCPHETASVFPAPVLASPEPAGVPRDGTYSILPFAPPPNLPGLDWSFTGLQKNQASLESLSFTNGAETQRLSSTPPNTRGGPSSSLTLSAMMNRWRHPRGFIRPTSEQIHMCFKDEIAQIVESNLLNTRRGSSCLCNVVLSTLINYPLLHECPSTPLQLRTLLSEFLTERAAKAFDSAIETVTNMQGPFWTEQYLRDRPLGVWISQFVEKLVKEINPPATEQTVHSGISNPNAEASPQIPPCFTYEELLLQSLPPRDLGQLDGTAHDRSPPISNVDSNDPHPATETSSQAKLLPPDRRNSNARAGEISSSASCNQDAQRSSQIQIQEPEERRERRESSKDPTEDPERRKSWVQRVGHSIAEFTRPRHDEMPRTDSVWAGWFMRKLSKVKMPTFKSSPDHDGERKPSVAERITAWRRRSRDKKHKKMDAQPYAHPGAHIPTGYSRSSDLVSGAAVSSSFDFDDGGRPVPERRQSTQNEIVVGKTVRVEHRSASA